jgi:hypothetical protein
MARVRRIDWCTTRVAITDEAPTPARGTATRTDEGYLVVDAYLARDGLLKYSDGRTSWLEWRPRDELVKAAPSFANAIFTDDHPAEMLDAKNAKHHSRGFVLGVPTIEDIDGVAYMRARIKVFDEALIKKMEAGQVEISIGFWSAVEVSRGTVDGETYHAIQRDMSGNHVASVMQGRSGPAVRALLDAAGSAVHTQIVRKLKLSAIEIASWVARARRADEVGMPVTSAKLVGPDGTEFEVPTWVAAAIEELREMKAQSAPAPAPEGEPAPDPAAPPASAGDEQPPPAVSVGQPPPAAAGEPPADDDEEEPAADADDEEKEPPMKSQDAKNLVRKRVRLERLAVRAKIDDAACDTADDVELARLIVATALPTQKARADASTGPALDLLLELAAEAIAAKPVESANPWEQRAPIRTDSDVDPAVEAQVRYLKQCGVEI